jgi:hypothetical protein
MAAAIAAMVSSLGLFFFQVGMPLIDIIFPLFNFFDKLLYLSPLQAYVAIGLVSKNFYFFHAISSPSMSAKKSITSVIIGTGGGVQNDFHSPVCAASVLIWGERR